MVRRPVTAWTVAASRGTTAESSLNSTSFSDWLRPGAAGRVRARWLRVIPLGGVGEKLVLIPGDKVPPRRALAASSDGYV